jgi:hypothetical protein
MPLFLLDVNRDPRRFEYRLVGTEFSRLIGRNLTGRYLDEVHPGFIRLILDQALKRRSWADPLTGRGRLHMRDPTNSTSAWSACSCRPHATAFMWTCSSVLSCTPLRDNRLIAASDAALRPQAFSLVRRNYQLRGAVNNLGRLGMYVCPAPIDEDLRNVLCAVRVSDELVGKFLRRIRIQSARCPRRRPG